MLVLLLTFVLMVIVFSTVFHELMAREDQSFSWPSSVYWTLTTMTTLGFGDITFESDAGRVFSIVVLLSGSAFLLVVLPFVFIQFVFIPWMDERERRRAPAGGPCRPSISRSPHPHALGPVEESLIDDAIQAEVPYVVIVEDVDDAGRLHDEGRNVMVGPLDDPETYHRARRRTDAAMVVATQNGDQINTNIAFTVREIAPTGPASSRAPTARRRSTSSRSPAPTTSSSSARSSARRWRHVRSGSAGTAQVIGELRRAAASPRQAWSARTSSVKTLAEARLREHLRQSVIIGVWDRGEFDVSPPDSRSFP